VAPFGDRSPAEFERLRGDIATFRNAYVGYLNETLPLVNSGAAILYDGRRKELQRLAVRADQAVDASGMYVALAAPPLMPQRPQLVGVASIAFAHEDALWRNPTNYFSDEHYKESYELVIEALDQADALLERREEEVRRRRRSPMYWGDRFLRAVLGFPAYLISLVAGFDRRDLSAGGARVLWLVSLVADVVGIVGFGRLMGWW
jgi:hypothetical protein